MILPPPFASATGAAAKEGGASGGQNLKSALLCTGEVPWKEKGGGGGEAGHRLPCVEEEDGCGPLFLQSWCHYTAKGSFMRRRKEEKPDAQAEREERAAEQAVPGVLRRGDGRRGMLCCLH